MSDLRKAAEMALEALEELRFANAPFLDEAMEALRTALAYTEQDLAYQEAKRLEALRTALATAPPKREWVGLTDEEIEDEWQSLMATYIEEVDSSYWGRCDFEFARAIEAKLKEKNK